ncbi:ABC transporter permease [Paramaledivibacter caminithermalis]|jgi:peptide/nickel transport system permease protein|uniref:Peptide/nickel transport system permease protein n=1 Tax=Paramaledivibacter caminithermalis (strain DSM 15212 / CIP 107654 / DViRD3) TaxID=1121301 RepID=A0A1M6LQU0_PARC5|nr:ABC transporter permease [Paramaledivibacter caminithermalis]SHJ73567.1 peptide/nickel transport system permease protein [Paramaledivibacter caminithermalis DSM 15212]
MEDAKQSLNNLFKILTRNKAGFIGLIIFTVFLIIAIFASFIAPYDPMAMNFDDNGAIKRLQPPSSSHLLGTTWMGRDVFSQMIMGSRIAMVVGILSAICVVFIGTNIGLIAGYYGGKVDNVIMRLVDIIYGIPFLPFALILVAVLGPGIKNIILAIVLITWRNSSRVIRSQVLTLKNRTFIEAARLTGASDFRILYKHIAPNVLPLSLVYVALSMASAIMTEASLSFLGFGDPTLSSWGKILYSCYSSQAMFKAWWWMLPPGIAITLLVLSGFLMSKAFEEVANPKLRER